MASARKRSLHEVDGIGETERLRHRLRNMWQFANLCQWIYLFGKAVKIDESLDVDVRRALPSSVLAISNHSLNMQEIEAECLKPNSPILVDIGLALLKFVSSQRGLTYALQMSAPCFVDHVSDGSQVRYIRGARAEAVLG